MSADSSSSKIKENTDSTTYFYAIRKCDTLERPAIFSSWKDCAVHVNGENCGLEYKRFETSVEASNYAFQEEKQSATNPERLKGASDDDEGDVAISKNRTVGKSTASKSSTDTASNGNGINNLGAIANPLPNFANPLNRNGIYFILRLLIWTKPNFRGQFDTDVLEDGLHRVMRWCYWWFFVLCYT